MLPVVSDSVRRLLSVCVFEIRPDENLMCTVCARLVVDAWQTYCGCSYCGVCIVKYLGRGPKGCCGRKTECEVEKLVQDYNVFRSGLLNRQVARLRVICPHQSCEDIYELPQMEHHLRLCTKRPTECPYVKIGCDDQGGFNNSVRVHLHDEALAHSQLLMEAIDNLRNEVADLKTEVAGVSTAEAETRATVESLWKDVREGGHLRANMLAVATDDKVVHHEAVHRGALANDSMEGDEFLTEVVTFIVDDFSKWRTAKKSVFSSHFYSHAGGYKLRLEVDPGNPDDPDDFDIVDVGVAICAGEFDALLLWPCRHSFTLSVVNPSSGEPHQSVTASVLTADDSATHKYARPTDEDNAVVCRLFLRYSEMQATAGLLVLDALLVRCSVSGSVTPVGIVSFPVDRFSERRTSRDAVSSPYFYSHIGGYKLRLRVHPGGDGSGENVSMYVALCPGSNDDQVEWPCRRSVTVSIVNQRSGAVHRSDTYSYYTAMAAGDDDDDSRMPFNRPSEDGNRGFGTPRFISHGDLASVSGLLVDDCLLFTCVVND